MKSDLVKSSLALLSAVFILGCQDLGSGPVGPDGLVPQFHAAHEDCTGHKKNDLGCDDPGDPGGDQRFNVTMTIAGADLSNPLVQTGRVHNDANGILMDNFKLDLSFLTELAGLTCGSGIPVGLTGELNDNATFGQISDGGQNTTGDGSDGSFVFKFFHADTRHFLVMRGTITDPDNWLPISVNNTMTPRDNGHWSVTPYGKGNKNGCRGAGDGVVWTATFNPILAP